jgi:hypothetical protein
VACRAGDLIRNPLEVEENLELLFDREPGQFGPAQALRLSMVR